MLLFFKKKEKNNTPKTKIKKNLPFYQLTV